MVDDVLAKHTNYGMTLEQVRKTLGPADVAVPREDVGTIQAFDSSSSATTVKSTLGYALIEDSNHDPDPLTTILALGFDAKG
ncbi:MAG TPA: hypothetical protein VMI31_09850, partial [Fimbriimonadaceae bacterium]|nr:hypothetical protein [Fimbriimonadaceae bacterium]